MEAEKGKQEVLLDYSIVKEEYDIHEHEESITEVKIETPDQSQVVVQFVIEEVEQKPETKIINVGNVGYPYCSLCLNVYKTEKGMKEHLATCSAEPLSCNICGKTFTIKRYLTRHLKVHTSEKKYMCECGVKFMEKSSLQRHILEVHMGKKRKQIPSICGKVFSSVGNRDQHLATHNKTDLQCSVCPMKFSHSGNLKVHEMAHGKERPFPCTICVKTFSSNVSLSKHMEMHERNELESPNKGKTKLHKCLQCEKSFSGLFQLRSHMATNHSSEKKFCCPQCGKRFSTRSALSSHVARHSGTVECKICATTFANRFTYKRHLKIHTREKSFECKVCGRMFMELSSMKRHVMLIHSEKTKDSEIEYDYSRGPQRIVGKYKNRLNLVAVHNQMVNVECSRCCKRFAKQKPLNSPMKHLEKPLVCYNCIIEEKMEEERKRLRLLHTEHPKICFHCDETFYSAECFKQHMQQAHRDVGESETEIVEVKVEIKTEEDSS